MPRFEPKILNSYEISCILRRARRLLPMVCFSLLGSLSLSACQGVDDGLSRPTQSTSEKRADDPLAAEVNGSHIYISDVTRRAILQGERQEGEAVLQKDPLFQILLNELIDQRLLSQQAVNLSLDQSFDTQQRLMIARERILSTVLLEQHLADAITEESMRRMYDEQAKLRESGKEVRARHIVVKDKAAALDIAKRLAGGAGFAVLAKELSLDKTTANRGGDLGFFTRDQLSPALTRAAFGLTRGERAVPFRTEQGWHVLEMTGNRTTPQPSYEDMEDEILSFMTYEEIDGLIKSLRESAALSVYVGPDATGSDVVNIEDENE